jgi:ketosteroid isomerase-like protein
MPIKGIIEKYFDAIHKGGWESYISDDVVFMNSSLDKAALGKTAYLEAAGRFFKNTTSVEIRQMLIENEKVAVIARYHIRSPKGSAGVCDVAEFLTVKGDKLMSSAIFFDTKALAEFMAQK